MCNGLINNTKGINEIVECGKDSTRRVFVVMKK